MAGGKEGPNNGPGQQRRDIPFLASDHAAGGVSSRGGLLDGMRALISEEGTEARREIGRRLQRGASFFGNPALLREAADVVFGVLTGTTLPIPGQFSGYLVSPYMYTHGDYTQEGPNADTYLTYPSEVGGPVIHAGFRAGTIHEIVFEQERLSNDGNIYHTQVIFFGLNGQDEGRNKSLLRAYYPALIDGPSGLHSRAEDDYPHVGIYLNFNILDSIGNQNTRLHGLVGANTTRDTIRNTVLHGEPGNREVFPWLGEHIRPTSRFATVVDNLALLPIEQTLTPEFFSKEIIDSYWRVEAKRREQ